MITFGYNQVNLIFPPNKTFGSQMGLKRGLALMYQRSQFLKEITSYRYHLPRGFSSGFFFGLKGYYLAKLGIKAP